MITEAAPRIAVFYKSFLKLISVIGKYFLHVIKKTGNLKAEIIIISRLFNMGLLFIVFNAGFFISIWEIFLSSAGKLAIPQLWFGSFLSSPLIPNQSDLGLPIALRLPETFHFKYLFYCTTNTNFV